MVGGRRKSKQRQKVEWWLPWLGWNNAGMIGVSPFVLLFPLVSCPNGYPDLEPFSFSLSRRVHLFYWLQSFSLLQASISLTRAPSAQELQPAHLRSWHHPKFTTPYTSNNHFLQTSAPKSFLYSSELPWLSQRNENFCSSSIYSFS